MDGRVLSEEEIQKIDSLPVNIYNLIATIRDRDKTIAELQRANSSLIRRWNVEETTGIRQQNTLMLSALEQIGTYNDGADALEDLEACQDIAREAIAKVKALTVSNREVSTDSSVPSEQPENSDLAKQVHSDLLWRQEG